MVARTTPSLLVCEPITRGAARRVRQRAQPCFWSPSIPATDARPAKRGRRVSERPCVADLPGAGRACPHRTGLAGRR